MNSNIAIKLNGVCKTFEIYQKPHHRLLQYLPFFNNDYCTEFPALHDISFEIKKGETLGIIGRNGAGKSTLLQIICGTLTQTSGTVHVNGRIAALLELGTGFNPEFTGRENVLMSATILGLSQKDIEKKMNKIINFADIGEFFDRPVKMYSSGMFVRLAFAVIAHIDADIWIIDEALAVGDIFFAAKCMRKIRSFIQEGGTLVFVSHDTGTVTNLCQRAMLLVNGKIALLSNTKEVSEAYIKQLYGSRQEVDVNFKKQENKSGIKTYRDQRLNYINASNLRNDLEIFSFNENHNSFGGGAAQITDVYLTDAENKPLSWIVGGEEVMLHIKAICNSNLANPIFGFFIKDKLGQNLFGDNTYLSYKNNPKSARKGQKIKAYFTFQMPILPNGDYSVQVALADGTQDLHIQHHWIHDALFFKSHSSSVCTGLIGIQMKKIIIDHE